MAGTAGRQQEQELLVAREWLRRHFATVWRTLAKKAMHRCKLARRKLLASWREKGAVVTTARLTLVRRLRVVAGQSASLWPKLHLLQLQ